MRNGMGKIGYGLAAMAALFAFAPVGAQAQWNTKYATLKIDSACPSTVSTVTFNDNYNGDKTADYILQVHTAGTLGILITLSQLPSGYQQNSKSTFQGLSYNTGNKESQNYDLFNGPVSGTVSSPVAVRLACPSTTPPNCTVTWNPPECNIKGSGSVFPPCTPTFHCN